MLRSTSAFAALLLSLVCPAHADMPAAPFAQQLVMTTLAAHPEMTSLAFHVTPPAGTRNVVIASNLAAIGKMADADELAVLETRMPRVGRTRTGDLSVELPMYDVNGKTVGLIGSTFHLAPKDDPESVVLRAQQIRDEVAVRTPSLAALFQHNR